MIIWNRLWNGIITIGSALEEKIYQKIKVINLTISLDKQFRVKKIKKALSYESVNELLKERKKVLNSRTKRQD